MKTIDLKNYKWHNKKKNKNKTFMQSLGNFIISNFSRAFSHLPLKISFLKASVKSLSKQMPDSLDRIFAVSL